MKRGLQVVYALAVLLMVLSSVAAVVPAMVRAIATQETISVQETAKAGEQVVATIAGVKPSADNQVTIKLTGQGLTFNEAATEQHNGLVAGQYQLKDSGKTLVLTAAGTTDPWPAKLYFAAENTTAAATTAKLTVQSGADATAGVAPATASVQVSPQASGSETTTQATKAVRTMRAAAAPAAVTFPASNYSIYPRAASDTRDPDKTSGTVVYGMAGMKLFYIKKTNSAGQTMYAISKNNNGHTDTNKILAALYNQTAGDTGDWGNSSGVSGDAIPKFMDFTQTNATGAMVGSTEPFTAGETYQLIAYNPITGTTASFKRLSKDNLSYYYYMPNTAALPSFQIGTDGKISLNPVAEGKGIPGQYSVSADGKEIDIKTYKMKLVRVVDADTGAVIPNAKVTFSDMQATTDAAGAPAVITPNGYNAAANDASAAFYWGKGTGDGTQTVQNISFSGSDQYDQPQVSLALSAQDVLSPTGANASDVAVTTEAVAAQGGKHFQVATIKMHKKAAKTLTIRKSAAGTPNVGVGAATFTVTRLNADGTPSADVYSNVTTDAKTGLATITLADDTPATANFKIQETKAPANYALDTTPYYFSWNSTAGVQQVGKSATGINLAQIDNTNNDNRGTQLTPTSGVLSFGDAQTQAIALKQSVFGTAAQGVLGGNYRLGEFSDAKTQTTDYGEITFTNPNSLAKANALYGMTSIPVATANPDTVRTFAFYATKAPTGYANNPAAYWFTWSAAKGVIAVGDSYAAVQAQTAATTTADGLLRVSAGVSGQTGAYAKPSLNISVAAQYQVRALTRMPVVADSNLPVTGVQVTVSDPAGGGQPVTLTTAANGLVPISAVQLATILGIAPAKVVAGNYDLRVQSNAQTAMAGTSKVGFTAPLTRLVRFVLTTDPDPTQGGFKVYNETRQTTAGSVVVDQTMQSTDPLKGYDGMIIDGKGDFEGIQAGDLGFLMSRDVLRVQDMVNKATGLGGTFTLTYMDGATTLGTATVTVPAGQGSYLLANPDALLGQTKLIAGQSYTVQITQTAASTGYDPETATQELTYSSGTGYSSLQNFSVSATTDYVTTPPQGLAISDASQYGALSWNNGGAISGTKFSHGGSQIVYDLTQGSALTLDDYPTEMNFGQAEVRSAGQSLPLQTPEALSQVGVMTPATTIASGTTAQVGVQVTQVGQRGDWSIDLSASVLGAEDDSISGATIAFAQGVTTVDGTTQDSAVNRSLALGTQGTQATAAISMLHGDGQTPGIYRSLWPVGQVHLNLPAGSGRAGEAYQTQMTWTKVEGPAS
ncbi:MAG: hypothetical protein LKJ48_10900 [Lactobacillus sp.]|nr:hypothetical protein [Lactobacillus sp.]